ncbi:hypothetical protein T4B_11017 [Trichinella pseudospiralis]|uniref:Uncharacterized protein n=1 Tax=Trichinella pseudospiralis TaxID=6337 RepID=A0A0V1INU1_TRIPS|nr:hypothetical protein T4B_11017 [Trichinella pseudospiralis]
MVVNFSSVRVPLFVCTCELSATLSSSFIVRAVVRTGFLIPQACAIRLFTSFSIYLCTSLFTCAIHRWQQQRSSNANPVARQALLRTLN